MSQACSYSARRHDIDDDGDGDGDDDGDGKLIWFSLHLPVVNYHISPEQEVPAVKVNLLPKLPPGTKIFRFSIGNDGCQTVNFRVIENGST